MKNYAKIGNRNGKPAYRTPATFRYKKYVNTLRLKSEKHGQKYKKF